MSLTAIILAAGHGKRMHSAVPKTLHPLLGQPLVFYAIQAAEALADTPPIVVVGHGAQAVQEAIHARFGGELGFALQTEQLGTGHAVQAAQSLAEGRGDQVLITFGDMPLLRRESLEELLKLHQSSGAVLTMTSVVGDVPRGAGRVLRGGDSTVRAIVEEAVATPMQLAINEYNVSAYCIEAAWLWPALGRIQPSPKGEYYLTDLVEIAVKEGRKVQSYVLADADEGQGINTRVDLADAEAALRKRINHQWMLDGVTLLDPATITIEPGVILETDVTLYPGTHLRGKTRVGKGSSIGPDTTLFDTVVGQDCTVSYSVAEGATLGNHVSMGPFCHLRKGAVLQDHVHLDNFGEVKDSVLGEGVKMGHFSYIGNAKVGKNVNISAGVITCNYDGKLKHPTEIGDDAFVGSDTMLVAPVKIGDRARTGAGSVVTHDVPDDVLVIGVPARLRERKDQSE